MGYKQSTYVFLKTLSQSLSIGLQLNYVFLERGILYLLQSYGDGSNLVLVGSSLKSWENSEVDGRLQIVGLSLDDIIIDISLGSLTVEDNAGSGTAKGLMGCGSDDIAISSGVSTKGCSQDYLNGLLASSLATRPAMWAMSDIR